MKLNIKKLAVSAGVLVSVAGTGLVAMPAGAIPAASHPGAILNAVGSDTTYWMMQGLTNQYNVDSTVNTEVPKDRIINTPPILTAPFPSSSIVPPETGSGATNNGKVYTLGGNPVTVTDGTNTTTGPLAANLPPNGSGAGKTALNADSDGTVDFSRSSSGLGTGTAGTNQYFAYALDALTWAEFPGTYAPKDLNPVQIKAIYTCDPSTGAPYYTDWSQVGGKPGAIKKFAPQTSSGTYKFFNAKYLGGSTIDAGCDSSHLSTFIQEHDATGVPKASQKGAILPFSVAQYTAASKFVIPDLRNGIKLGTVAGIKASATTINENPGHFFGVRYVYNILRTDAPQYDDSLRFAGVDAAGPGYLCNGNATVGSIILTYGFFPLASGATGGVLPASNCRLNPADL